jgi:uncharacterized protein
MNSDNNKHLAREFYRCFSASDIAGAMATLSDDATFWIAGKPQVNIPSGELNRLQITQVFEGMLRRLKNGLKMNVNNVIAEGDQVALEVVSYGELKSGLIYDQQYHVLMRIREGKIVSIREYLDTQHVKQVWFASECERNQKLLEHAFAETERGDGRAFIEALAEDAVWTIIGSTPWSQIYNGKQSIINDLLRPLNAQFANKNTIVAHHFLAAGEHVVVQARGKNRTHAGQTYENSYCWVFRFSNGKVTELIEYADTALMESCLIHPQRPKPLN